MSRASAGVALRAGACAALVAAAFVVPSTAAVPALLRPVSIVDSETVAVGDDGAVVPPVSIVDSETVAVGDGGAVVPPVSIVDSETVAVGDGGSVGPPPRAELARLEQRGQRQGGSS